MSPPSADVISHHGSALPSAMRAADAVNMSPQLSADSAVLPSNDDCAKLAASWMHAFQNAVDSRSSDKVLALFRDDAYWKDLLTLEFDHHCKQGKQAIKQWLDADDKLNKRQIKNCQVEPGSAVALEALPGVVWIVFFYTFETAIARGRGCVRLEQTGGEWKAKLFYQGIEELIGHEEPLGPRRPKGVAHGQHMNREVWVDRRKREVEYDDHDPQVVVIGAGQAGLTVSARLKMLSVDTLILEKLDRIGASWANRYKSLVLHDPVWYDHLPYIPFPPHWPVFTPKDKLADWLKSYAESLELNVWTNSSIQSAQYDAAAEKWTLEVDRAGTKRTLHPRFVILATGHSGEANMPQFKGADQFKGTIVHSSQHKGGHAWRGKKVVVIGANNSGNDCCADAYEQGCDVTMVQRSATYVMSSESVINILFEKIYCEGGPNVDACDILFNSTPNPIHFEQMSLLTKRIADYDKETLDGLKKAGFNLAWGPQGAGFLPLYFTRGGGYYLDVGASKLIADGKIKLKSGVEVDHLDENGIVFADGSRLDADLIVCATGYKNMKTTATRILGDAVKDAKEVWGLDDENELRTVWRDSGVKGFYYMAGNLALCRFMSKRLALQIKAKIENIQ